MLILRGNDIIRALTVKHFYSYFYLRCMEVKTFGFTFVTNFFEGILNKETSLYIMHILNLKNMQIKNRCESHSNQGDLCIQYFAYFKRNGSTNGLDQYYHITFI